MILYFVIWFLAVYFGHQTPPLFDIKIIIKSHAESDTGWKKHATMNEFNKWHMFIVILVSLLVALITALRSVSLLLESLCREWCHPQQVTLPKPINTVKKILHIHASRAILSRQPLIESLFLGEFRLCQLDIENQPSQLPSLHYP